VTSAEKTSEDHPSRSARRLRLGPRELEVRVPGDNARLTDREPESVVGGCVDGAKAEVFEVEDRLVEQLGHMSVVEAIVDVLALTGADD
jgi:hypothetical protein